MTRKEALDLLIEYFADFDDMVYVEMADDDMVYVEMADVIRKELEEAQPQADNTPMATALWKELKRRQGNGLVPLRVNWVAVTQKRLNAAVAAGFNKIIHAKLYLKTHQNLMLKKKYI